MSPSKKSSTAWYDSPLYYDIVYADYTKKESRFIEGIVQRHCPQIKGPLRVLEPACGSGRLLESMALRGHHVAGFDLNRHQVAYAQKRLKAKGLAVKVWRDGLEDFSLPKGQPYDVAHCFVSTFKYVRTERGAVASLRRMAKALRPGGLCLIGIHLTDYAKNPPDHERWAGRRQGIRVVSDTWSAPAVRTRRTEAMRTRMKITQDGKTWEEETHWKFRTYSPTEVRALLAQVPELKLVVCHDFHYDLESTRPLKADYSDVILVLQKR